MKTSIFSLLFIALLFTSCSPGALDRQEIPELDLAQEQTTAPSKRLRTSCERLESNREEMFYYDFISDDETFVQDFPVENLAYCRISDGTICQFGSIETVDLGFVGISDILDDATPLLLSVAEQNEILDRVTMVINNNLNGAQLLNIVDIYDFAPFGVGILRTTGRIQHCTPNGGSSGF